MACAKALQWERTQDAEETEKRPVRVGDEVAEARPCRTFPALVRSMDFILRATGNL